MASLTYLYRYQAMRNLKHILRSALFALFGSFAGLDRTNERFRYTLIRVELPLSIVGRFPIPLVLRRTSDRRPRLMTVASPRDWSEKIQSLFLRPAFGLKSIQAYRSVMEERRHRRREKTLENVTEKIKRLNLPTDKRVELIGKLVDQLMDLTQRSKALERFNASPTKQDVVVWANNNHLGREHSLLIPA